MNCDEVRCMLDAYRDGELDPARQLDLETHLSGCPTWKDAAEDITNFCSLLRMNTPVYKGPPELKAKIRAALRKESKLRFRMVFSGYYSVSLCRCSPGSELRSGVDLEGIFSC